MRRTDKRPPTTECRAAYCRLIGCSAAHRPTHGSVKPATIVQCCLSTVSDMHTAFRLPSWHCPFFLFSPSPPVPKHRPEASEIQSKEGYMIAYIGYVGAPGWLKWGLDPSWSSAEPSSTALKRGVCVCQCVKLKRMSVCLLVCIDQTCVCVCVRP